MKTAFGTFAEWLLLQIPLFISSRIDHEIAKLPVPKDGVDGTHGKDGISVVDSEIAADGHLVFTLSDGRIIDAGELPTGEGNGQVFVSGNAWQITVSATAPSNPALNDLWLDIS